MSEIGSAFESALNWALGRQLALVSEATTGSTNDDAKKNAFQETAEFVLYLSAHQSAGRGRGTNHWLDTNNGESLLSTWSYEMKKSPQAITAPRIGLALYAAATKVWPSLDWSLKAPNDLFLNARKVAGLLVETLSTGDRFRLLVGLGFNVLNHPRSFDEATHLSEALGHLPSEVEMFRFLDELKAQFQLSLTEIVEPTLSESARQALTQALNANAKRPFEVKSVSPQGDLIFGAGQKSWSDL